MRYILALILFFGAVGAFAVLSQYTHRRGVEVELKQLSERVLKEKGYGDVEVAFDHNTASLGGYVDSEADKKAAVALLQETVTGGYFPEPAESEIQIRPTIPPVLHLTRKEGSRVVRLEGKLAATEEANKRFLGSQIHAVAGIDSVENNIELDATTLPFQEVAEFASLAAGLISASESVEIAMENGAMTVSGKVENAGIKFTLMQVAQKIVNDRLTDKVSVEPPRIQENPSELHAEKTRFGVTVTGKVPESADKEEILESLVSSGLGFRLSDGIEVVSRMDEPFWLENATELIPLYLSDMEPGAEFHYTGTRVLVRGTVSTEEKRDKILGVLSTLAKQEKNLDVIAEVELIAPMADGTVLLPELEVTLEENLFKIAGIVPSESFAKRMEEAVAQAYPDLLIKNELRVVAGAQAPDWLEESVSFLEEIPRRLKAGSVSIRNNEVVLSGATLRAEEKQILHNIAVNTVPTSFSVTNLLTFEEEPAPENALPEEQRIELEQKLSAVPVYFASGSDVPSESELENVKKIWKAIEEKQDFTFRVVVGGFSDTLGNPESNRLLSIRRATSVRDALVGMGLPEDRVSVESFGEDKVNTLRSNRWKARRVEVRIEERKKEPGGESPAEN